MVLASRRQVRRWLIVVDGGGDRQCEHQTLIALMPRGNCMVSEAAIYLSIPEKAKELNGSVRTTRYKSTQNFETGS